MPTHIHVLNYDLEPCPNQYNNTISAKKRRGQVETCDKGNNTTFEFTFQQPALSAEVEMMSGSPRTPQTLVFYDSEGTDLPAPTNIPKFTEICFLAVSRKDLLQLHGTPRVLNKISLCFNPEKPINPSATEVSGLTNAALQHSPTFQEQVPMLMHFLQHLPQPVLLVAHNGMRYDFPLLARYLKDAGVKVTDLEDIMCADSVPAFQRMLSRCRLRLDEMYRRLFGGVAGKHTAEDDCQKLMEIVGRLDPERFVRLCQEQAQPLNFYNRPSEFNVMFARR
ncbi:three-prime repair exonuclease 1 [Elysia marginata]|uniref:Three-prime repair exonuclease 1 n=1 Tax=Elysia marginata TaxID=1093978 RepID=A0AAV4JA71_9GAST|nr:three-prime repair exonuclease 1 [Elysia marginata]